MRTDRDIENELFGVKKNISLRDYTTFKIGGPAKYFYIAKTREDLVKAILTAKKIRLPFFILGGGSNILVSDRGYDGLVIKTQNTKYKIQNTKIVVGAGTLLGQSVNVAANAGLTGLEWCEGIPGTIGGAIRGNVGAFGRSAADIIKEVEVFDAREEKIKIFQNKDCKFEYKDSIFKQNPNLTILSAVVKLKKGNKKNIQEPSPLSSAIKEHSDYRKKNHPINFPSAGCVFKNHQGKIKNQKLLEDFSELKEFNKRQVIPAGWLIEKSGLKGKEINNVKISEKHCNFIVNLGKVHPARNMISNRTRAEDVMALIRIIKQKVKNKFGIELEKEIQLLGF